MSDIINRHILNNCPDCAASLESIPAEDIIKRQVFDIPPPKVMVTEHQAEIKVCPCCQKRVPSAFPSGVNAPVQYGVVIQAWAVYLQNEHYIPEDRLQTLFVDLLWIHMATATIIRISKSVNNKLEGFESTVLDKIKISAVKHLDETGFRVSGLTQCLHYRHQYYDEKIPNAQLERLTEIYNQIVREGLRFHEQLPDFSVKKIRGRTARRTGHNLLLRLQNYREDVLRFLFDPRVPYYK